jgi:hypothetical protein
LEESLSSAAHRALCPRGARRGLPLA